MKLVIIKMDHGKYVFTVPANQNVKAGEDVLCDTQRGENPGYAVCDNFECDDATAERIIQSFSGNFNNMKSVIAKVKYERFDK